MTRDLRQQLSKFPSRLPKLWCLATPVELQADCLAAVWAHRAQRKRDFLDPGDVDQALQMAFAIGDDLLQKEAQGVPSSMARRSNASAGPSLGLRYNVGELAIKRPP